MNLVARRRPAVIAFAAIAVLLAGCAAAPESAPSSSRSASKSPTTKPSPTPTQESLDLSFGSAEALVEPQWVIGWNDPFVTDPGFAVLDADDGQGSWSYTDLGSGCEYHFYQGQVTDLDWTRDDRTTSDQMLAIIAMGGAPTAEDQAAVAENAGDISMALQPEEGTADLRIIGGAYPDGRSAVQATRMFGALAGGITISVYCPAGVDASSEFGRIADSSLRVLLTR